MKPVRRGPSWFSILGFTLTAFVVGGFLIIGTLWALGVDLQFWTEKRPRPQPTGFPVPVLARPVPAYTKVTVEHFLDAKSGELTVRHVSSKDEAEKNGFITDRKDILGRVLTRDKPAGFPFVAKDLYPKDTRPGVVAGIPEGKRSFVLAAEKVQGIHGLKLGDQFDLLASVPVDMDRAFSKLKLVGSFDPISAHPGKRANVRVLVQNGAIVLPVAIREIPTGSPTAKGGPTPSKPVQEVTIALDPEEVAPLHEALAIQATLMCVARSGRPDDAAAKTVTPGSPPPAPMHAMEIISNGKRQTLVFPIPGKGPIEPPSLEPTPPTTDDPKK
jgi:Flp pilus assembly protein CpaB